MTSLARDNIMKSCENLFDNFVVPRPPPRMINGQPIRKKGGTSLQVLIPLHAAGMYRAKSGAPSNYFWIANDRFDQTLAQLILRTTINRIFSSHQLDIKSTQTICGSNNPFRS